ncbi:MAG TPA: O-antigen ligase family protein [Candidatus Woesebacteria bacterium]|nr:O-antigen ligase family protein [Candidatus Woesebacteria bacterium]
MKILFSITLFLFTFGQLGRIAPFEIPAFGNLYEIGLFSIGIYLFTKYQFAKAIFTHSIVKPALYFFGWLFVTLVISFFSYKLIPNVLASLYFIRLLAYFFFFLYFDYYIKQNKKDISFFNIVIIGATLLIIFVSVLQYFLYPNLGNIAYQGWDPHLYRLVGLFFDPPITASIFFLLGFWLLFSNCSKYITYGLLSVLFILFFLTYSRGGFLALLVTLAIFSLQKMKLTYILAGIAIMICAYVLVPKNISEGLNLARTTSIQTRLADYNKAMRIWQKDPLLGIGYNHIRFEKDSYEKEVVTERYNPSHASSSFHSSFLIILVTSGVVGVILYGWLLVSIVKLNTFTFYSVVFLSVFSLTDNVLLHPFILFLFFILIPVSHRKEP